MSLGAPLEHLARYSQAWRLPPGPSLKLHSDTVIQCPSFSPASESSPTVKLRYLLPLFAASAVLSGCLGNSGNPVAPPSDIRPVVGDGIAGIEWTPQLGVSYLAFASTNASLTTQNWTSIGFALLNGGTSTVPPALLCNATNGLTYYFTVDAHTGTAPGGPGSPLITATARSAGGAGTWNVGAPAGLNVNGVGYAAITTCLESGKPTGIYAAVGPAGAIFSSTNGSNWTSRTPAGYSTDLYAVVAITGSINVPTAPNLLFVAVGAGGAVIRSGDGVTWTSSVAASGSAPTLRSISISVTSFVAVGDGGRIQTSSDGVTWTTHTSNTTANLHSIQCVSTTCVAAGDGGVIDISVDGGTTWTVNLVGGGASALRAVAYGNFDNNEVGNGVIGLGGTTLTSINTWVVVGDNGTAFESAVVATGITASGWNATPIAGAANLVAIAYTTQFVAVDAAGHAFTSQLATANTWSPAIATGLTDPVSITTNGHGFVLLGSSGDNATSF